MSYNNRVNWRDEVVEYPHRYTEVVNQDGTVEHTAAPGETIQPGVPQSATNFNAMDEALQHIAIAYDMLMTITQAEIRDQAARINTLESKMAALSS